MGGVSSEAALVADPRLEGARTHSPALALKGLRKAFDRVAVDDLDLEVRVGELYALLGPNGAGKTTTLRMIAGLMPPMPAASRFSASTRWPIPIAAKRITAWLPDEPMLYDKLTPLEYLEFVAGLWGVERERARAQGRGAARRAGARRPIATPAARASRAA